MPARSLAKWSQWRGYAAKYAAVRSAANAASGSPTVIGRACASMKRIGAGAPMVASIAKSADQASSSGSDRGGTTTDETIRWRKLAGVTWKDAPCPLTGRPIFDSEE